METAEGKGTSASQLLEDPRNCRGIFGRVPHSPECDQTVIPGAERLTNRALVQGSHVPS